MKGYIFSITYNFDGDYVVKKCDTYEEAKETLKSMLQDEVKTVKEESGYDPSVLEWGEDDVTLVYAAGYTTEDERNNYAAEECAYYRIFELERSSEEFNEKGATLLTREEKIKAFAQARDNKLAQEKQDNEALIASLMEIIRSYKDRINELIDLANVCRDHNVPLGDEQNDLRSKGIETQCFVSNGWSHLLGFNRSLTAIGFYNGGANGKYDIWVYEDGCIKFPPHEVRVGCDNSNGEPNVRDLNKWLDGFAAFEKAFLKYIDELM